MNFLFPKISLKSWEDKFYRKVCTKKSSFRENLLELQTIELLKAGFIEVTVRNIVHMFEGAFVAERFKIIACNRRKGRFKPLHCHNCNFACRLFDDDL